MKDNILSNKELLFEIAWDVCNSKSDIGKVILSKLDYSQASFDNYILIGPNINNEEDIEEFTEDQTLLADWKKNAKENYGLSIKIGYWNCHNKPIAIMVDYSSFMIEKDKIFASFWERFFLDSLTGGIDYIEKALFGYATGKVIESYTNFFNIETPIAHFHEWTSGAGILYLKQNYPNIATVFTAHSTVLGKAIAKEKKIFHSNTNEINGEKKALEYGIAAKHSLEKSAAYNTDCFTTNSDYSAIECNYTLQKNIDLITPSGINTQITKQQKLTETQKEETREILAKYLKNFYNNSISKESLFISIIAQTDDEISGVNAFLDSLAIINKQSQEKHIVAFINIPSSKGVRAAKDSTDDCNNKWKKVLTHEIVDCQNNRILNQIENLNLNEENSKIKILYMPSEINANDGIFNINYSSFIQSMNLCVFPSYYQPWSNTVLDCISFNIPMIITKQSGIGDWIIKKNIDIENAIDILDRDNILYSQFVDNFAGKILNFINNYDNNNNKLTDKINKISILAQWDLFYENYIKSYNIALNKSEKNKQQTNNHNKQKMGANLNRNRYNKPQWKGMIVHSKFPEALKDLDKLANNLWWCWNYEAKELFEEIDPKLWDKYRNPIKIIKEISHSRLVELEKNEDFMYRYNWVLKKFEKYIAKKPDTSLSRIGYFSMEYGLDDSLKIFSGGLGILAGDYLKEASDTNTNMVAVGFLYKFGYFKQKLSLDGDQFAIYNPQNPSELPIELVKHADGTPIVIKVGYPGRLVYAQIWKVFVGRITLYLLDTENSHNNDEDKTITHALYGGDNEMRLKQEILLGIGGIRALEAVGESPEIYHCNEGHAAFINIERLRKLIKHQNFTFQEALEIVRSSCLYTTHTPVPAGHDSFPEELMMTYLGQFPERLQLSWNEFMNLGRMYSDNHGEHFSMSNLASATSQEINGVSRLHGDVSKDMFKDLWQGYTKDESHIGYVTNGVHYGTWTAKAWRELYESKFGDKFLDNQSDNNFWKKINEIPDEDVWEIRQNQREILINHVKQKLHESWIQRYEDPKKLIKVFKSINKDALTIGFARRFATYKRAYLLFSNLEKLDSIVNNPERPVQFLFAGKAHPNDKPGQGLIKEIVRISKLPQFVGKIIFLEDYDMTLAKRLVQGVDIWLNTPTRPLEASGTSGMKAVMNGALNFSVLDGWWCEGYRNQAGWALPEEKTYEDQEFQNKLDAETIYSILEYEILPLFYNRNMDGLPKDWVKYVKNSISYIAPMFTTKRMIDDYKDRFYSKLTKRYELIKKDDFQLAKDLAQWKSKVEGLWDDINIISMNFPENASTNLSLGEKYKGEITIDAKGLSSDEIGIELVITDQKEDGTNHILEVDELVASSTKGTQITFSLELNPRKAGIFNFGLRMFPKHKDIPYRQDFCYVKWL